MPRLREPQLPTMRTFWLIWGGQSLSLLGSRLVQFALIWHLASSTGSGKVLAAASAVALAPEIVLVPFHITGFDF